jgi:chromate reductase
MQLLLFAASVRHESCNKKLIALTADILRAEENITLDLADFGEFDMPLYDANKQDKSGLPDNTLQFIHRLKKANGLIIASPEYNFSVPGTLKNLIDWVSRDKPMPWAKKPVLLMSASVSVVGGNRGLWATRIPLEACGAYVFPDMFSLASAYTAFEANGQLKDQQIYDRLKNNVKDFVSYVNKFLC